MFFGVTLAHMTAHLGNLFIVLLGDLIGYSIHATGFLPYLQDIEKNGEHEPQKANNNTNS